jgi:hypothetical protein
MPQTESYQRRIGNYTLSVIKHVNPSGGIGEPDNATLFIDVFDDFGDMFRYTAWTLNSPEHIISKEYLAVEATRYKIREGNMTYNKPERIRTL